MAEGDNRAVYLNTGTIQKEIAGGTAKDSPIAMPRLPEDGATGTTGGRSTYYASANQKDILPEHTARRDAYPFITAASS